MLVISQVKRSLMLMMECAITTLVGDYTMRDMFEFLAGEACDDA